MTRCALLPGIAQRDIAHTCHVVSYRRYVLEQRLARCASELADPRMAHRTVTDIGYSWAFFDSAHFSKAFKTAYGMSPRDYRAQMQPG
jgi:AraC-like DNA-binding protein